MSGQAIKNIESEGQPFVSKVMNREELWKWILRRLGAPLWKVELTQEHLDDSIESAVRWFAAKKGVYRLGALVTLPGKVEYTLAPEVNVVLDVIFEAPQSDISLIFSPFLLLDEKVPYDVFAAPQSIGLYSSYTQTLQYVETAKRILSAELDWQQRGRCLFISPTPKQMRRAIIEFNSSVFNLDDLSERDHDLVKRYALALAMRDLAMVRGKYSSFPGAQGEQTLNVDLLVSKSDEMIEKLNEEITLSGMPMFFSTG
jgi:hypothetical protein